MSRSIVEVIAAGQRLDGGVRVGTRAIHGKDEPAVIADQLGDVVDAVGQGAPISECLFHVVSVGSVTGLRLADGSQLVVKAYQPRWSAGFLRAVLDTQMVLHNNSIACARPLGGPARCGRGLATVETFLPDPGQPANFGEPEQAASAEGLADLIAAAGAGAGHGGLENHPLRTEPGRLYPTPHSPLFDFDATTNGTDWIDDLARLAKAHLDEAPAVIAHTDWSARNVRLSSAGVVAVYDLDSLARVSLATALGQAAATWKATGQTDDDLAPDLDDINSWLDCYPSPLNRADRSAAIAAALWVLAYTARCEHAIDPDEQTHHRARPRLRQETTAYHQALTTNI